MSNQTFSFGSIHSLSSEVWTSEMMATRWKWRDRSMESVIQRVISVNKSNFDYLGIVPSLEVSNGKPVLRLTTSKYIGAIPILSPIGKPAGDLYVVGRYGEDAAELMPLIEKELSVEFAPETRLVQNTQLTPPILLECCKYVDLFVEAERLKWRKFTSRIEESRQTTGSTLWREYALQTAKNPISFDRFKNKRNILTTNHEEWGQLCYVLNLAISEIESFRTPFRTQSAYRSIISSLRTSSNQRIVVPTTKIQTKASDPSFIKELKRIATIILNNQSNEKVAWRVDYAKFFEVYVQYLIREVGRIKGAKAISNPHYKITTSRSLSWGLKFLEPDVILKKESQQYVVDAKYKSHMFNMDSDSSDLKDSFRHDFHQVLAYSSLNSMQNKKAMLVYPNKSFAYQRLYINSPTDSTASTVYLVGVPMVRSKVLETIAQLSSLISFEEDN